MVEETEYWVAYESPSDHLLSMTWAGDSLWLSDLFYGRFYRVREIDAGLEIMATIRAERDPFMQARDLAWDGNNLWSLHWGDLIRHNVADQNLASEIWISEGGIGSPNLHHMKSIAWDGENMWSGGDGILYRHGTENFTLEPQSTEQLTQIRPNLEVFYGISAPAGMSFNGDKLWVADRNHGFVYQLDASNPLPDVAFPILGKYAIVQQPHGLAWSEENLWLYDWYTNRIYKVKKLPDISLDPEDDWLVDDQYTVPEPIGEGEDAVWTLKESPYLIEGGIAVPAGSTLTIQPGVIVYVRKGDFTVEGVLRAVGTPDQMIVFTHADRDEVWGDFTFGRTGEEDSALDVQASDSILKYVKVQYSDNGILGNNAFPRVEHSILRKNGVSAIVIKLGKGLYASREIVGNRIEQQGGSIKIEISQGAIIPKISIRENSVAFCYSCGIIINSESDVLDHPPRVVVEHNIFENGFRGAGGGFSGVGNVIYRHNYNGYSPSGGGVQFFHPGNEITYNLIEYTFESGMGLASAQQNLREMRGPGNTIFRYNTVRSSSFQSNLGDPSVVVEYNNLMPDPGWETWASGMGKDEGVAEMRRNWWGTSDLQEIWAHIPDSTHPGHVGEEYAKDYTDLIYKPILTAPNGVGFIRGVVRDESSGAPISEAEVTVGELTFYTSVDGVFFTSAPDGRQALSITAVGYEPRTHFVDVTAGETSRTEIVLARR